MYFIDHSVCYRAFLGNTVPQILYKNQTVCISTFKNEAPTPYMTVYHTDGSKVMIDCEEKQSEDILNELIAVAGKPE